MKKIKILPDNIINQISAGEIIERPASVVKELIENSIDANSTSIKVEIKDGGKKLIKVTDNGEGIARDDLFLAFERHATSKISDEKDLNKISTLGFRGEALPSIASVSKIKARSKTINQETGYEIIIEGGNVKKFFEVAMNEGFIIEVKDLFYNTPVRKKFLKKTETELFYIENVLKKFILIYPEIEFTFINNFRKKYFFPKAKNLLSRIEEVYNEEISSTLIPFKVEHEDIFIDGFISPPHINISTSREINLFVNKRFIKDRLILSAIKDAYSSKIPQGKYPYVILNINIPHDKVDVNVHPTKIEVKFAEPQKIYSVIKNSISMLFAENVYYKVKEETEKKFNPFDNIKSFLVDIIGKKEEEKAFKEEQEEINFEDNFQEEKGFFSKMKIIGSLFSSIIILEDGEKAYFIDQHAAHERINFEKLKKQIKENRVEIKKFLIPDIIELSEKYKNLLNEYLEAFKEVGFIIEKLDEKTFVLKGIPSILEDIDYRDFIISSIDEILVSGKTSTIENLKDKILSSIACKSSITANTYLDMNFIKKFLKELDNTPNNLTCPHGRPIIKEIPKEEIYKWFKRL